MTDRRTGSLSAAGAGTLFGASNVATVGVLTLFTPVGGALARSVVAAVMVGALWFIARWWRSARGSVAPSPAVGSPTPAPPALALRGRVARALIIGACGGPLFLAGLNLAVAGTGPTVTAFVSGLYSVFAAALAPLVLREPLRVRVVAGLVAALAGCALLSGIRADPAFAGGFLAALAAAGSYAFYLVLGRRWSTAYALGPLALTGATIGCSIVALGAWVMLVDGAALEVRPLTFVGVASLVVMATSLAVGQTLVVASVRRIQAARTAAFLLLNPVTALVLAAILLGERLGPTQLAGATLVLAGIGIAIGLDGLVRRAPVAVGPR